MNDSAYTLVYMLLTLFLSFHGLFFFLWLSVTNQPSANTSHGKYTQCEQVCLIILNTLAYIHIMCFVCHYVFSLKFLIFDFNFKQWNLAHTGFLRIEDA